MDLSLDDLLSGLEAAQQKKSKVRLSERNVVELVAKLRQLGLLGDELLYTTNGKEYVTRQRVEAEVRAAVRAAGGRIPLVDLPTQLGLDLVHCERAAEVVVAGADGAITQAQGELFSTAYFDGLAAEVDEALQESGVVAVGDLARRFGLGTEMISGVLSDRVASGLIRGKMEAGVIYTQAYLARIKAQLRGALRGASAPLSIPALVKELGIEGLASLQALVPSLVEELAAEGSVSGKLAAGGTSWVPSAYVAAQQEAVRAFFQQNGYIGYDTVKQYGVPNAKQFLAQHFPDGIALESAYVSPAVVDQVEATIEEALAAGSWCDVLPHVPTILSVSDTADLLSRCKAVAGGAAGQSRVLAGTCVVAASLLDSIREQLLDAARKAADEAHKQRRAGGQQGAAAAAVAAGGKGAAAAESGGKGAAAAGSDDDDDWDMGGKKGKKGGRGKKGKGGGGGGSKPAAKAGGGGKSGGGGQGGSDAAAASSSVLSIASLAQRVVELHPDTEAAGADGDLPAAIAAEVRPAIVAEYERALHAIFTAGAEKRRRVRDAASAALDSAYERLQLYGHGTELFAKDEATLAVLQRHLLRSAGAECVDALLRYLATDSAAVEAGQEGEGGSDPALTDASAGPLSAAQRAAVLKDLPPDVKPAASTAVEKLGGASLEAFQPELDAAAEAAGLRLRRLDKKAERSLVFAQRKLWEQQAAAAPDASTLLAVALPLLLARHAGRAVSLPGRALAAAVDLLRAGGQLPEDACQLLADFHAAVVEQLKLQSGGEAAADKQSEVEERLEGMVPRVRALLAGGGDKEGGDA